MEEENMTLVDHLDALRRVLVVSLISVIPGAVLGWMYREDVLRVLIKPVRAMNYELVFITPTEAMVAYFKLAFFAGIIVASPVMAFQFWRFILPALHANEKRNILILMPASLLLFIGGIAFAYFSVYNIAVQFLLSFGGEGLSPMLSLSKYISFAIWFLLPFGFIFEMPLVILALAKFGVVTPKFLASKRKWAFLGVFVLAAVITPTTDVIAQGAMGIAVYLLYEISILLAYFVRPRNKKKPVAVVDASVDSQEK